MLIQGKNMGKNQIKPIGISKYACWIIPWIYKLIVSYKNNWDWSADCSCTQLELEFLSVCKKNTHRNSTAWKVTVFGVILVHIFPDSDWIFRMGENADQNNSEYGHFTQCRVLEKDFTLIIFVWQKIYLAFPQWFYPVIFVILSRNFQRMDLTYHATLSFWLL